MEHDHYILTLYGKYNKNMNIFRKQIMFHEKHITYIIEVQQYTYLYINISTWVFPLYSIDLTTACVELLCAWNVILNWVSPLELEL